MYRSGIRHEILHLTNKKVKPGVCLQEVLLRDK